MEKDVFGGSSDLFTILALMLLLLISSVAKDAYEGDAPVSDDARLEIDQSAAKSDSYFQGLAERAELTVDASGRIFYNGVALSIDELREVLAGLSTSEVSVIASDDTRYSDLVPVLRSLGDAGKAIAMRSVD
jgi:biopolymer transport protein ExbD